MVSHWSLSDSKFPQVSRALLSILVVRNNTLVWMVSTRALISNYSSPCITPLVTVQKEPITIGIIVTFMFHSFFHFLCKVEVLIPSFCFTVWSAGTAKSTIQQVLFFFLFSFFFFFFFSLIFTRYGRLAKISWSICISKSQRSLSVSFSRTDIGLNIYH